MHVSDTISPGHMTLQPQAIRAVISGDTPPANRFCWCTIVRKLCSTSAFRNVTTLANGLTAFHSTRYSSRAAATADLATVEVTVVVNDLNFQSA